VAQGLAFGLNRPVIAVDSLMIVAEDARRQEPALPGRIWVAMDARMDEIYAACYLRIDERWRVSVAPALWTVDALARTWQAEPPLAVAGSAIDAFGARLPSGAAARFPNEQDRAGALLALAHDGWRQGALRDAAEALPVYLRDKVALTRAERAAAGIGAARDR
jgi:tRNA threonylcarbamoyladenosine biosynthesis protein TsaB